jgi:hypothetical protein
MKKKTNHFNLRSTEFGNGNFIPPQFISDGKNQSPPISWTNVPPGTQSFVLILDDRSSSSYVGKTVVHWVVINLPSSINALPENIDIATIPNAEAINNDFGVPGYTGPGSFDNDVHLYRFNLFAMKEKTIDLPFCLTARQFNEFYKHKILGNARLTCKFIKH